MLLEVKHFNAISDGFRKELEDKIEKFGKQVRYRFHIEHNDPEPGSKNKIFPGKWTLPKKTFRITDPHTKKLITVGMVERLNEKGEPEKFRKVQISKRSNGLLVLDLENPDDREVCMFLEIHPYHKGAKFEERGRGMFVRIDELKKAQESRSKRQTKTDAMYVATHLKDDEVRDFASALGWDETDNLDVLRNRLEEFAEGQPQQFTDEFNSATWNWRAVIKRALDKQIIIHHPAEDKVTFLQSGETIAILPRRENSTDPVNKRLAEFLMHGGDKGEKMYKRIEALVKAQKVS